jgi:hypothetical protein
MTSARLNVDSGSSFTLPPYSLESVVEWRDDSDRHWRAGIEWQKACPGSDSTYDECVVELVAGDDDVIADPPPKTSTTEIQTYGASAWTLYSLVECSAVAFYEGSREIVEDVFRQDEIRRMENVFWTGAVGGQAGFAVPHLMDTTETVTVSDPALIQMATTVVTGGTSVELALGLLEKAFADCYPGEGVLHVNPTVASLLQEAYLLVRDGDGLYTVNGNRVVIGRGYPGTGPSGQAGNWMVITPPVFGYRSDITVMEQETTLNRAVNTVQAIAERTYLLAYDCCLFAISVPTT